MLDMTPLRVAFCMEQTLGHVTHTRNLRSVVDQQQRVAATWLPIPFDVGGPTRVVPVLRSNWSVRASWRARRALGRVLGQTRHDALFFHSQVTSLFSVDLMRRYPSVVSLDATPINYDSLGAAYNHRPAGNGFMDRQKYALNRRALHAAAGLVSWSEWARDSLVADYGVAREKVRVVAPGAAAEYFAIGDRRVTVGARADGPVRVLFVGGDFERKGGRHLLEALPESCELDIVTRSDVPGRPNVRVHQNLGPNSPGLLHLFEAADVFALPSLGECLAVVLMEATAAGLPIVTTSVGALAEAVVPGESGIVVPAAEVAPLRRALELLESDASLRQRMGRAGRVLARQKFNAAINNQALLSLVEELAVHHHGLRRTA